MFSLQGKTSLDIANLRGDTPISMLQVNAGSIWVGQKVMEKVREENQSNQRHNFFVKLTMDKVSRECIPTVIHVSLPLLHFYINVHNSSASDGTQ